MSSACQTPTRYRHSNWKCPRCERMSLSRRGAAGRPSSWNREHQACGISCCDDSRLRRWYRTAGGTIERASRVVFRTTADQAGWSLVRNLSARLDVLRQFPKCCERPSPVIQASVCVSLLFIWFSYWKCDFRVTHWFCGAPYRIGAGVTALGGR